MSEGGVRLVTVVGVPLLIILPVRLIAFIFCAVEVRQHIYNIGFCITFSHLLAIL